MSTKHENCFDLLRLLLASAVLYSHSYLMTGRSESPFYIFTREQMILASIAVMGFFGMSGLLVSASFERSKGFFDFFKKRVARIMPAYWVCLVVTAFIFAPLISLVKQGDLGLVNWFGENSSFSYLGRNAVLFIGQWSVGSTIASSPYPESLNGSLWSLYPEFQCYVLTFLLGYFGTISKNRYWLPLLFVYFYVIYMLALVDPTIAQKLGPQLFVLNPHRGIYLAYLTGMILHSYRDCFPLNGKSAGLSVLLLLFTLKNGGFLLIAPLVIPLCLISLGNSFVVPLKHDFSYGVYIYGFVVQQFLACFSFLNANVYLFLGISLVATLILGGISWFLIERPVLRWIRGGARLHSN